MNPVSRIFRLSPIRLVVFCAPIVWLSSFLIEQALRKRFWEERLGMQSQALGFEAEETEMRTLELLTPTELRVLFFLPSWSTATISPYADTTKGRKRDLSSFRRFTALRHPRRLQLTCGLQFQEGKADGWWRGAWRGLGEGELPVGEVETGFRLEGMDSGWRVAADEESRLVTEGPQTRVFPLFVNREGETIGLEIQTTSNDGR